MSRSTSGAPWSPARSADLYGVNEWGCGYFSVSASGTLLVHPDADPARSIDLHEVVEGLGGRDLHTPVIVRFPGILRHRMTELRRAFDQAIAQLSYDGTYRCVYPIKVNQQRHVCEVIRDVAMTLGFGLEVGSKPELLAGLALTEGANGMPLVCNGFKDREYVETVVLAAKMGRNITPVIEQMRELGLLTEAIREHSVQPSFGLRAQLASKGVGRWASSVGYRGKFGLTVGQIVEAVEYLRKEDLLGGLRMLHCHMGSQVFDIRAIKATVSELTHLYVELLRLGAPIEVLDIGGGLGIDYDGSQSASSSSVNYTLDQYAVDVVHRIGSICDEADVPHPQIMTESGRAIVAHSSVLVCSALGGRSYSSEPDQGLVKEALAVEEPRQPLLDIHEAYQLRASGDPIEVFADAEHALSEASSLFSLGHMDVRSRAACEELFWAVAHAVLARFEGEDLPEALEHVPDQLADLYFLNCSIFQSLLDAWAIEQVFPIAPIHRLDEIPDRRAALADISCDSDGRIDRFPGERGIETTLPVHALRRAAGDEEGEVEPYHLGVFLVGAYQETLGDLHNLLGDTHIVHVTQVDNDQWRLETVVEGDTVAQVLRYVQFEPTEMRDRLRLDIEGAIGAGRVTLQEGNQLRRFLDEGLNGYTYLE